MKSKYLEIQIRRQQAVDVVGEKDAVNHRVCVVAASKTATPGTRPQLITKAERKSLMLVSDDSGLGVRLGNAADFTGLAFMQVNDSANVLRLVAQDHPAAVFLDLDLPALAGWEAAEQFLQDERTPSLVLLTGRTGNFGLNVAIQAGMIVDKSAGTAQLLEKVGEVLAEPDADRGGRKTRQQLLVRWLRPYIWPVPVTPTSHWGINE
jgi:CheY-like chemotaxis protein